MVLPKMAGTILRRDLSGAITLVAEEALHACERSGPHLKCSSSLSSLANTAVRGEDRLCALSYMEGNVTSIVEHCRFAPAPAFDRYQVCLFFFQYCFCMSLILREKKFAEMSSNVYDLFLYFYIQICV